MDLTVLLFLTSGLFLGWSLGANDAANVFGTAVGTRMVRFGLAAVVCSVFVVLGAVVSGAGAAHTLGTLGSVNAIGGAFMAALAAAITVYTMTMWGLPVSTSQAIVGAIIGWNLFSGSVTDRETLIKIVATWVACPVLAGVITVLLFGFLKRLLAVAKLHLLRLDAYTRVGLVLAGAFGSYSLGANNIANVMGVFVPVSPFTDFEVAGLLTLSSIEQLFLLGAVAISVGVFTYSKRVMMTVGSGLMPMSPVAAFAVVVAHSIVLFAFASEGLEHALASAGLPTIPLVPVSSSQAIVGGVIGLGLLRGGKNIDWRLAGSIGLGWVTTPIISALLCFVCLFFLQNVFNQRVYGEVHYSLTDPAMAKLAAHRVPIEELGEIEGREFRSAREFLDAFQGAGAFGDEADRLALRHARIHALHVSPGRLAELDEAWLSDGQRQAVRSLEGERFTHDWQLAERLDELSPEWRRKPGAKLNRRHNKELDRQLEYLYGLFAAATR